MTFYKKGYSGLCDFILMITWVVLVAMTTCANGASLPFPVTPEEQAWLDSMQGQSLRVAPLSHYAPYEFLNEKGEFVGVLADFLQLYQDQLHLNVEIVKLDSIPEIITSVATGVVDLVPGMTVLNENRKSMRFTNPILSIPFIVIAQEDDNSISTETDLAGKKVALFKGQKVDRFLRQKYPNLRPLYVENALDTIEAVAFGKADAAVLAHATAIYLANRNVLTNVRVVTEIDWGRQPIIFLVANDLPELTSLLNKAIAAVSESQKNVIFNKWTGMKSVDVAHQHVMLTSEERLWLAQHPVIRVGAGSARNPIEFYEDGKYKGLAIDNLKHIEQMLGVSFEFIHQDWQQLIVLAQQQQVDLFSCVTQTAKRDEYLLFTEPYVKMPVGIFAQHDVGYFSDVNLLAGKKVAVVEGAAIHDYLVANYPELDLVLYKTLLQGIRAVQDDEVFAIIGNTVTIGHCLRFHSFTGLKMVGEISFVSAVGMGVRKDWPLFRTILQKALDATSAAEKNTMSDQWIPLVHERPVDYRKLWQVGFAALLFILVVLIWNRRLSLEVVKRTATLDKINDQYREAQAIAQLGHWELDLKLKELKWSVEVYKIFELEPEQLSTIHYDTFMYVIHPEDRDMVRKTYEASVRNKTEYAITHRLLMNDGRVKFVTERCRTNYDKTGTPLRSLGTVQDVTELIQAEESRVQLLTAIEQASESFVITDSKAHIQYVNPAFERLTGYSKDEVLGKNPRLISSGKLPDLFYQEMWQTLNRGEVWTGHFINKKKDGSLFEEDASIAPVVDEHGVVVNYIAVKRDVTEQVIIEKQLRQAMKMEAIGTLAGGIAHDFNNILGAILGYSEMVMIELPVGSQTRQDMESVVAAGNRAAELVKQILTFSRQEEDDFRPLRTQLVVKESLKMLRSTLPTTINLQQNIDNKARLILGDPTQINQVLLNLCTNAKHAMNDASGVLTVSLSETQLDDMYQLPTGTYLDLKISDSGCGIDPAILTKVFDPFFTTKVKGKGTGLGLSVVHGIVKRHNGNIVVTSELGQGTTFHVYLPVIVDDDSQAQSVAPDHLPRGNERILFVDDEATLVEIMERKLAGLGYKVTGFVSSVDALTAFRAKPHDFDVVITDMTMPNMTGVQLTKEILALEPTQPIILCTGFSEVIDEDIAKSIGIREYLKKPVDLAGLAKAVRKALEPC